ncbi:uncharacterized protein LOC123554699 isoform X2 [Mercenaria mercenaria]|uniref:uncharacterized protein LOC123554699 isoform X2 n=1 Tax=Mercenaria mercenaria TaxID=6596 RepID=UPI00234E7DA9|nr:uncharacterized protein LOC123554699 isoform X2 [Mercenaria mercenaria]
MDSQYSFATDTDENYEVLKRYDSIKLSPVNNASLRDDKSNASKSDMYITPVLDKAQSREIELIEKRPAKHQSSNSDIIIGGYLSFPSAEIGTSENTFNDLASLASKVNTYEELNKSAADTRDDDVYATINNENVLDSENSNLANSIRQRPYKRTKTRPNDGNGQRRKCGKRIFVVGLVVMLVIITISSVATTIFIFTSKDQGHSATGNDVTSVESSNTGLTDSISTKPFSTSIPTTSTTKLAPERTGSVSFTQTMYIFHEGGTEHITCEVKDYLHWQTITLAKEYQDDRGLITTIFMISNTSGSVTYSKLDTNYTVNYTLEDDGVSISLKFRIVTCDNEGLYTCAAIEGDPQNVTVNKSSSTIVNISCIDCGFHELITNTYVVDQNGKTTFNSSLSVTCVDGLELTNVSVNVVTCEADGSWHGEPDCAIPGSVSFTQTVYTFDEGDTGRITCEVKDNPRWQTVLLAKEYQDDSGLITPIFMISNATGSVTYSTLDISYTVDYTVKKDRVSILLKSKTVTCDNEGLYTCAAVVGNPQNATKMKSASTVIHISCTDCGIYEPISNEYMVDQNGKTTYNSSLSVTCMDGLELTNESVKVVTCKADGKWHGVPDCKIPGSLSFTANSYAFKEGTSSNVTCEMKDNSNWKTLLIGKIDDRNGDSVSQIFTISNVTGSVVYSTLDNNYNASYTLNKDGASISLEFDPVTCASEGRYMCAAIVDELKSPLEINNISTTVNISTESKIPEITVPDKIYLGREAKVKCTGLIGKGKSGLIEGRLMLETNFGENGSNVTYNGSDTPEEVGCYFKDSISVKIPTTTDTSDLWTQCVIRPLHGNDLLSEKKEIQILTSFVVFGNSSYIFNIGEKASITCDVQHMPDWKRIEIRRSDGEVVIGVNSADQLPDSNGPHIRLVADESNFANDAATLDVVFDTVMCSDAMGEVGDINYTCAVMTSNLTTEDLTTVIYQRKPEVPILEMSREIIENKFTLGDRLFYCKGDVGDPPGTIEVQSNFNGSYETFLAPLPGIDNNTIGWIVSNKPDSSECKNYKTIGFAFHNVTMDMQYKRLRCTIHPSDKLTATMDDLFDEKPINIVSDDICVGKAGYVSHPYFCHLFVECDKTTDGHIVGVPVGCSESENECFDDEVVDGNPCVECSSVGGCNITGIKCDKTYAATYKGENISFTCDTKDFGEVTHISVNSHAAAVVNVTGMMIPVIKYVDVKVSEGSVSLSFSNVSCNQEGEYVIRLNSQTDITHSLVVISPASEPSLNKPSKVRLNERLAISCSGDIGRDQYGNAATHMFLEVKFENESMFSIYNESVEQDPAVLENCRYTQTVRLIFYPDVGWNNSEVRCAARNETNVVQSSTIQSIKIDGPNTYFETSNLTGVVGESVILTCIVDGVDGLTGITITKGTDRAIVVSYPGNYNSESVTVVTEKSNLNYSSGVLIINMTVQCGDDGDYFCTPSGLGNPSEAGSVLSLHWKALAPVLDPSSDMVENSDPWVGIGFETVCTGELGSQNASVYLESNADGRFKKIELPISSEYKLNECSNFATIKFNNKYTADWNGTVIKCVIETEEEKLMDAEYVTVVPETFCNGHANGFRIPHPFDCRAWFMCGGNRNITAFRPNKDCQVDECLDDLDTFKCIPCDSVGICRRDPLEKEDSTPTNIYFTSESETVQIGNRLQVECVLEGSSADWGAILTRNSKVLGEEHVCNVSSSGIGTCNFMNINGIGTTDANNSLTAAVTINPVKCEDEGTYYCKSVSDSSLQASFTLSVIKPPSGGVLLSLPKRMVLGQIEFNEKVTCQANVGYPAGEIRIEYSNNNFESYNTYSLGNAEPQTDSVKECSVNKTVAYKEHTFTESWNNTDIRCAVYNHTDITEPALVSDVQRILLIENDCPPTGLLYYYHPFNCHYYILCFTGVTFINDCGINCPYIKNTTLLGCMVCDFPDC